MTIQTIGVMRDIVEGNWGRREGESQYAYMPYQQGVVSHHIQFSVEYNLLGTCSRSGSEKRREGAMTVSLRPRTDVRSRVGPGAAVAEASEV